MAVATTYVVRLYKVLSEDPWRAKPVIEERYKERGAAREAFIDRLERLEEEGFRCEDYASALPQLCLKPWRWDVWRWTAWSCSSRGTRSFCWLLNRWRANRYP